MSEPLASLGKPIALGRAAEIYAWEAGYVLKLFHSWMSADAVAYEALAAETVQGLGLPVPAISGTIDVGDRLGLILQRMEGISMLAAFKTRPWMLLHFARLLAELHATMHVRAAPELRSQRQRLEHKIRSAEALPPALRDAALKRLRGLPDGDRLCHGDFHPDNILMTAEGPIIIDWQDATHGHPLADVARTSLLLGVGAPLPGTTARWMLEAGRCVFHSAYIRHYFRLRPGDRHLLDDWRPVVAAARLNEGISEEQERLLALVRAGFR